MTRKLTYRKGKMPLSTIRSNVEYGFAEALTTYGQNGIKV
jgi:small subunit ribosomal protein S3